MTKEEENRIIKSCQKGDLNEFALLYDAYIEKIYKYIYYKTFNKQLAEDLTSDTFLKAIKKIDMVDARKGSFSSWLYRIALNNVRDYHRAKRPNLDIEDVWGLSTEKDPRREIENEDNIKRVKEYMQSLEPVQRDILILRLWDNMPYRDIAEIVDKKEHNCRVIFHRAITELRGKVAACLTIALLLSL